MKTQKLLLALLVIIGIVMIVLGVKATKMMIPPILTGVGFFIIAYILNKGNK